MRRPKATKVAKNVDNLIKESKCRECSVVVTKMDFAKILGKFTKVKIQYESSSPPKSKKNNASPNSNARLKSNENGMVLIHRNAYHQHPVKEVLSPKTPNKVADRMTPRQRRLNNNNILKESNRIKKPPVAVAEKAKPVMKKSIATKKYEIIFEDPKSSSRNDPHCEVTLFDLLPAVDFNILPSNDWTIEYLPINEPLKEDKVYDKIAAELEDLMKNKPIDKTDGSKSKDDFPSILDILNESSSNGPKSDQSSPQKKSSLASSEVEAMLLGEPETKKPIIVTDTNVVSNLLEDVSQLTENPIVTNNVEEPGSPSILDETLQQGINEQLTENKPEKQSEEQKVKVESETTKKKDIAEAMDVDMNSTKTEIEEIPREITHVVFKQVKEGKNYKCVTCPKNLKYTIHFQDKPVELLGAPKFISSREDLQVLLQIINESELESFYVLH